MAELDEELHERLLELVAPYASDMEMMAKWLNERLGHDIDGIMEELDVMIASEKVPSWRTDLRILRNALEKV